MFLTWSSFNNIRMLLMAFIPVIIFYLIWLVNTSEGIRSEEGTLLDLICWPDGNAIPALITCGAIIAIVIELYGLYQLFKTGLPKKEYNVTNGLFYYIWALIFIIIAFLAIMFYSGLQSTIIRAKIKGGITKAMLRYATHLPSKVAIDRLQTHFHCCGRENYEEWFFIPWDTPKLKIEPNNLSTRKYVADNVPYSCCSMNAMCPCIHYGVTQMGPIYKYDPASLQIIAARYLHTAYNNGLHVDNKITCYAYLLRSVTDTELEEVPKRKVFKKRKFHKARTLDWVMAKYRPNSKYTTSSGSDFNSSDELLKPIYE
ncbi:RDS/peripherin-like protein xRDS35 isoform X2 [Nymphalis io]|uniref:RDS/peripherin-like protein xRDS35 isoform X2 n=1 Tax=Inachis io TaxID=171585 RepID=UPI002169D268|nr:RDS/peripherin-like protein xRDS35 isoform X2 [Nymphalis io]